MYKLIAIDMDGTLLDEKKEISNLNKEAIINAQKKGSKIVLATGRPLNGIKKYFSSLQFDDETYVLCFNGGLICTTNESKIFKNKVLLGSDAKELYELSQMLRVNIHAFDKNGQCISPKNSPWTNHEVVLNNLSLEIKDFTTIPDDEPIIKIMLVDEPQVLEKAIKNIPPYFKQKYNIVQSAPFFLEFLNKETDKWYGIKNLADYLGIKPSEIMAIGDSENDLLMIKNAGLGIAMENATPEVLSAAKYVTATNNQNGVGLAINKFN